MVSFDVFQIETLEVKTGLFPGTHLERVISEQPILSLEGFGG